MPTHHCERVSFKSERKDLYMYVQLQGLHFTVVFSTQCSLSAKCFIFRAL